LSVRTTRSGGGPGGDEPMQQALLLAVQLAVQQAV